MTDEGLISIWRSLLRLEGDMDQIADAIDDLKRQLEPEMYRLLDEASKSGDHQEYQRIRRLV